MTFGRMAAGIGTIVAGGLGVLVWAGSHQPTPPDPNYYRVLADPTTTYELSPSQDLFPVVTDPPTTIPVLGAPTYTTVVIDGITLTYTDPMQTPPSLPPGVLTGAALTRIEKLESTIETDQAVLAAAHAEDSALNYAPAAEKVTQAAAEKLANDQAALQVLLTEATSA